jgi:hypothetical protein
VNPKLIRTGQKRVDKSIRKYNEGCT